ETPEREENGRSLDAAQRSDEPVSMVQKAWSLAASLAAFLADGCRTVSADQYRERLAICDTCSERQDNTCGKCGCFIPFKARGLAMECPLDKWPRPREPQTDEPTPQFQRPLTTDH